MVINIGELKQKIINFLKENGPSLPVHITKVTGMNLMFSSAILSEMLNERTIKQSYLKIGSSSLYLLPGQEELLENFATNLRGFEKEAFLKLKEKKVLEDENQLPAIRVALQGIKDFAVPVYKENKKFWKYFLEKDLPEIKNIYIPKENIDEEDYKEKINNIAQEIEPQQKKILKEREEILENISKKETKIEEDKKEELIEIPKKQRKKRIENQFFIEIKEKISSWGGNLIEAVYVSKKELLLRSVLNGKEVILVAFDKKRISENDLVKLLRKSKYNLPLFIISRGELSKKMNELLNIFKNVSGTEIL